MSELLSISIPTWNRAKYLNELLSSIKSNIAIFKDNCPIKVYVGDNHSTDDTFDVVSNAGFEICYIKNPENIGGDPNILRAYRIPQGRYIWVIGDDELLPEGSIKYLIDLINIYNPGLIINKSPEYNTLVKLPLFFEDYRKVGLFAAKYNPHLLIAHSLISANIIRRDCYDLSLADTYADLNYGHFYAITGGLKKIKAPVLFAQKITLIVRDNRAGVRTKGDVERIERNQILYLKWLKNTYEIDKLDPENDLRRYEKKLFLNYLKNKPFRTVGALIYRILLKNLPFISPQLRSIARCYKIIKYGQ